MTIGGAFLGGGVELVPAGSCKLVMEIRTEDGKNLATTFSVAGGGQTYTTTAGADGRAELIVPSGVTYTVTTSATGYDGLTAQTVTGDSATIQYVRFEAVLPRVKKSGDAMTGDLSVGSTQNPIFIAKTNVKYGDARSSSKQIGGLRFQYANSSTNVGYVSMYHDTDTYMTIGLRHIDENGTALKNGWLNLYINPNEFYATTLSWSVGTNSNDDKILTIKMANSLPSLCHSSGNETWAGTKTFNAPPIIGGRTSPYLIIKSTSLLENLTDSKLEYGMVTFRGGDDATNLASLVVSRSTDEYRSRWFTRHVDSTGKEKSVAELVLRANKDGTSWVEATETPNGAVDKEVATANWSIGKFVKKSGDTMTGNLILSWQGPPSVTNVNARITKDFAAFTTVGSFLANATDGVIGGIQVLRSTPLGYAASITNVIANNASGTEKSISLVARDNNEAYATCPTPPSKTENSNQIATCEWINSADVICRTVGNQTVGGRKTYTGYATFKKDSGKVIRVPAEGMNRTETPANDIAIDVIRVEDDNNLLAGGLATYFFANGQRVTALVLNNGKSNQNLGIKCDSLNANPYGYCPSTPTNATGQEIATADWVLGKLDSGVLKKIALETTITDGNLYINNLQVGDIVVLNLKTGSNGSYSGAFTYTGTESQQTFGSKVSFLKPSSGTPYIESSYIWISNNGGTSVRLSCLYDKYTLGATTYTSGSGTIHTPSGFVLRG